MLGAIIGDVAGSSYEHAVIRLRSKEQSLFPRDSRFTDDTVMTCAIAWAMMDYLDSGRTADLHELCVKRMREWGAKYPDAGYGGRFRQWLKLEDPQPYNSYGNGSAMRVSPVAWLSRSLEETEKLAKITAEVTHNHPDGVKGAQAVAGAVYLALNQASKNEIADYVGKYYPLDFTLDEIRPKYKFEVSCQNSVPQAIRCFLESKDFEDAIRNAVSLAGDTDTQAAIAGSIAGPFYRIPNGIASRAKRFLNEEIEQTLMFFGSHRSEVCFPIIPKLERLAMKLEGFGIFVKDMPSMIRFYRDVLGFEIKEDADSTSNVYLVKDGTLFLLYGRKDFEKMTGQKFHFAPKINGHYEIALSVENYAAVDAAFADVVAKGATSVMKPTTEPWGQRTCYVADPEGNLIEIGSFTK